MPAHPARRRPLKTATFLLATALTAAGPGRADPLPELPDFGDASGNLITPTAERRLGQAFMRSIRASEKVLDDPLTEDYLEDLGRRLTRHTPLGEDGFTFFVIDDPTVNAFAGPGGHIGIHSGLILTTKSESELAAVLAHEIAHVTQKHLARSWQVASDMTVPQAAVLIAAAVLGATVSADAGMAAALGGQAALVQRQIDFTRANEHEADRIGINLLAEAEFEPQAMASFFTRMGRANRDRIIQLPEFLQTHPVTTDRIAEALDRAEDYAYRPPTPDLRYQLLRERLRSRSNTELINLTDNLQRALDEGRYRNRDAARYGLALAQIHEQQPDKGLAILQQLMQEQPQVTEFVVTAALTRAEQGLYDKALALLDTPSLPQDSRPLLLTRSRLLLDAGRPAEALSAISPLLQRYPLAPQGYILAAQAYRQHGEPMAAHEHLASYHYLRGDTEEAIRQLEIALRIKGLDFYHASRLESRLENYRRELVESTAGH